jgi:hypothetical protein
VLDYAPEMLVGESHVVHDPYLFIMHIHASSFGTGWQGEMAQMAQCKKTFHRLGVQDVTEFNYD